MEFELSGNKYIVGKLDARLQFHIIRRLAPVLSELAPALKNKNVGAEALVPLTGAIAKLSDEDADYCLFGLLKAVNRFQGQGLGTGPVATGNTLMYNDIDVPTMLQLAWKSMSFNMSGFFAGLPSDLKEAVQTASVK